MILLLKDDFPSWLYQVKMGTTAEWEYWDGIKPDGTMCSLDMNPLIIMHTVQSESGCSVFAAGIEIDEKKPGYKHTVIYPRFGGNLDWLKAEYQSVYGTVKTFWEDQGEKAVLYVSVPANTTATICLDKAKKVTEADGFEFIQCEGYMKAETGSGDYKFVFEK